MSKMFADVQPAVRKETDVYKRQVLAQLETGWRRLPRHLAAILSAIPLPGRNTIQNMNR